jgi:hypothetical protein
MSFVTIRLYYPCQETGLPDGNILEIEVEER